MLVIVKAIERFHIYLYRIEFTVVTDCNAVTYAINKAHLNPRISWWTLRLQDYKLKTIHRSGQKISHVDALSRVVASIKLMSLDKELQFRQLKDSHLQSIAQHLEESDDEKYILVNGLVFKKDPDKSNS